MKEKWPLERNFILRQIYRSEKSAYYFYENGVLMTNSSQTGIGFSDKDGVLSTKGWNNGQY